MIFNTWDYFLLFLVPAAILFRVARPAARPWIAAAYGCLFFVYFSYTQLGGAVGAACVTIFLWESFVSRFYKPASWVCMLGVTQTILFLCVFKYRNFLSGILWPHPSHNPLYWKNAFLPLGISFFTFEFLHYAWDRYRGKTEAGKLGEYMAFILFFPTMVAGPIKRYQDFLPKLRSIPAEWLLDWQRGITRILAGLVKKFAVADLLTAYTNHLTIPDIAVASRAVLPLWLLAYGFKIYFDFSAYSDIAIGSARLFGIRVPENFDWPYLQTNITDFWRRWHISLSTWLLDYVYIPLGGSRVSIPRIYANLLVTIVHQRSLAWCRLQFHHLGRSPWDHAGGAPLVAPPSRRFSFFSPVGENRRLALYLYLREPGLGVFLYGFAHGAVFLPEIAGRLKQ